MNEGEKIVIKHFEDRGYEVKINNPTNDKGIPDFRIFDFETKESFYVEEKTNQRTLTKEQEERIISLIKKGKRVLLARFNSESNILFVYELDEKLGQKVISSEKVKRYKQKLYSLICWRCQYNWEGRVKKPKSCPNCKRYDWNKKEVQK